MTPRATAQALRDIEERSFDCIRSSFIPLRLRWRGQPQRLAVLVEGWPALSERPSRGDDR